MILIGFSTVGFSYLAYLKYESFRQYTQDSAYYGYAFHQTLHGRLLPSFTGYHTILAVHPNFLLLLWVPVFWLSPFMCSLFVYQSLMISLAAWPIYLLARHVTGNRLTAGIAAAGLLVFPPMAAVHVGEIHDDAFGVACLLFAFYFFETGNFRIFALFLAASLLAKETIVLNTIFFGVYALVRRRDWKWVTFPIGWSAVYFWVATKVLVPMGGGTWAGELYTHVSYFQDWGQTPLAVLKNMASHPFRVISILCSRERLGYLCKLLLPVLLVAPFGSWAWLVALPSLAVNLLSSNPWLRVMTHWYGILLGGLVWASFVTALPFWGRWLTRLFGNRDYARGLCALALLMCVALHRLWLHPEQYAKSAVHEACSEAVRLVPQDASVFCPDNMLAHFANRPAINSLLALSLFNQDPNRLFDYDYVVFDHNYTWEGSSVWLTKQASLFKYISGHPDYRLVYERDNVFVFQRVGIPKRDLNWRTK